jgi:cytochrome d ubiquinol oxidase subunit I
VHLACIWIVAFGVNASAYFIIAANSFMQHPLGARLNPPTGRAELTDFVALLTNNTAIWAFLHAVAGSFLTAGAFVAGISAWLMVRSDKADGQSMYRPAAILGSLVAVVAALGLFVTGDFQGKLMFVQQPMKMASAEGIIESGDRVPMTLFAVGSFSNDPESVRRYVEIPGVTSFLATGNWNAHLSGGRDLQAQYQEKYGTGIDYVPNLAVTFWAFRLMIGFALFAGLLALLALWLTRRGQLSDNVWLSRAAIWSMPTVFLASIAGWIFTEMGRQPWVVAPNPNPEGVDMVWQLTARGVSQQVSPATVITSLVLFTLLYGVLAVAWYRLMHRYTIGGVEDDPTDPSPDNPANRTTDEADKPLSFAY